MKEQWFFTFGCAHHHGPTPLAHRYVIIEGDFGEARQKMVDLRGPVWSFQYSPEEFEGQAERYGLTEIKAEELEVSGESA